MRGNRFDGQSILVSGDARGCDGAAARMLATEDAAVTVVDRQVELGRELVEGIRAEGGHAVFAEADMSDASAVKASVAVATETFGTPMALFNHAGSIVVKPFLEAAEADYEWLMNVSLRSMFFMPQVALPGMLAAGGGAIVCTSSVSAIAVTPMEVLYGTTKGAVHMFARAIAVEYRDRGIRCNAVCPGFIRTPHGMREVEALNQLGVDASG